MTNNELKELNITRLKVQLEKIREEIKPGDSSIIKQFKIYHKGREINSSEIDFTQDCIFICDYDFLGILGYFGLLKVNKVSFEDYSTTAIHSRIRTNYMIVNSTEAKYARLDNEYQEVEDIPESFRPTNFISKDIVLWRLVIDPGIGKASTMYDVVKSLVMDRFYRNKLNWIFFIGTEEQFKETYNLENDNTYLITNLIPKRQTHTSKLF